MMLSARSISGSGLGAPATVTCSAKCSPSAYPTSKVRLRTLLPSQKHPTYGVEDGVSMAEQHSPISSFVSGSSDNGTIPSPSFYSVHNDQLAGVTIFRSVTPYAKTPRGQSS